MQFQTVSIWWTTLSAEERRELCDLPSQPLYERPDLLVIGDGIMGLATAYFAAERGLKVQVITESSHLANDANGSLGDIFPNAIRWRSSPLAQPLAQASRDWWAKLAVRPDFQVDWRVTGAVMVDERNLLPNPRQKMLELLEEGYSVRDVDAEQVALLEPQLSTLSAGGLQFPSEAVLHPLKAAVGFARGIRRFQGRISVNCSTRRIERVRTGIAAVETTEGRIQPRLVVVDRADQLPRQSEIADSALLSQDTVQEHRAFLATVPMAQLLSRPVLDQHWILQLKSGEIVIAADVAVDLAALDQEVADLRGVLSGIVKQAGNLLPALKAVPVVCHWSSIISTNADQLPVIDQLHNPSNLWTYQDLSNAQVLLAPMVGRLLTDWMTSGERPEELIPFAIRETTK